MYETTMKHLNNRWNHPYLMKIIFSTFHGGNVCLLYGLLISLPPKQDFVWFSIGIVIIGVFTFGCVQNNLLLLGSVSVRQRYVYKNKIKIQINNSIFLTNRSNCDHCTFN